MILITIIQYENKNILILISIEDSRQEIPITPYSKARVDRGPVQGLSKVSLNHMDNKRVKI